ncbi:Asp23/Gls24 family envelope stress response protein [Nocardia veterana]|uniref:Asp23/Gls24 family envelope stress response protein n=1 Tax=Nocardia veterana TaxID=132249 RepID=A0A7X6LX29_9NOCA|nr:Asp23/Gls24 family envelope stress response protein [Nocardia veterana]NKY86083.1 Asp23/Gls24 family envelope stress response protein [Nocardia veterana]
MSSASQAFAEKAEYIASDAVIAAVAARAAASVPGVVRLEPGVLGLLGHLARTGRQWWTSQDIAPSAGVRIRRSGGWLKVQVDLSVSDGCHVGEVGRAVQQEVVRMVAEQTGMAVDAVSVAILDIQPGEL